MWKLKETALGKSKELNAHLMKEKLEALSGKIPGLLHIEVGIDYVKSDQSADVVLYTEFATKEDLENYRYHPDHTALIPFINEVRAERWVVDYEL